MITATDRAFAWLGTEVDIPKFTREKSVRYLAEATGLDDPAGAAQVADELGDLPLAVAQLWFQVDNQTDSTKVPVL